MGNERRLKSRYPLELNVRFQTMEADGPIGGVGQTVNISSNGMHLACSGQIPEGTRLKMFVEWPTLLNGTTPLQLITVGTVVRSTAMGVSVVFESYQFRTMSRARRLETPRNVDPIPVSYGRPEAAAFAFVAKSSA